MEFSWQPIFAMNTVLCIGIMILGLWGHFKTKDRVPLAMGIAYGIFCITHIMTLLGLRGSLLNFILISRLIAYLLIAKALHKVIVRQI